MSSLDRGLRILDLLGGRRELRLTEVATMLEVSRPTAFRLLVALESRGYVEHARREHVYRLGQAIHVLAAQGAPESVLRLAEPALSDLRALSGETANLALVNRTTIVYAAILDGRHTLRMSVKVGETVPPHATALGKAILSRIPPASVDAFVGQEPFRQYTAKTILDRARLDTELKLVGERGYAVDDEECDTGAFCIAGAILGRDGFPVGGISISGLAARMSEETRLDLGGTVRSWCQQVSKQVGDTRRVSSGPEEG